MLRPKLHVLPGPTIPSKSKVCLQLVGQATEDTLVRQPLVHLKLLAPPECGNQIPNKILATLALLGITARPLGLLTHQDAHRGIFVQPSRLLRQRALRVRGGRGMLQPLCRTAWHVHLDQLVIFLREQHLATSVRLEIISRMPEQLHVSRVRESREVLNEVQQVSKIVLR